MDRSLKGIVQNGKAVTGREPAEDSRLKEALDGMYVQRIEMPIAGRPQVHAFRDVVPPKLHRFTKDEMFDAQMCSLGGDRQPKRASALLELGLLH